MDRNDIDGRNIDYRSYDMDRDDIDGRKIDTQEYWGGYEEQGTITNRDDVRKLLNRNPNAPFPKRGIYINGITYQEYGYISDGSIFNYLNGRT